MTRRWILAVAALSLVAAACGGDGDSDGSSSDPAAAAAQRLEIDRDIEPSENATTDAELPEVGEEGETQEPINAATDVPGEPLPDSSLRQNDCFDRVEIIAQGRPAVQTTRLRCNEPHHLQVFHMLTYPAEHPSVYPGVDVVRQFAIESCYREFEPWVGQEYELSELEIDVIIPTKAQFEGDVSRYRGIHCILDRQDGEPMVDTAQGSGW